MAPSTISYLGGIHPLQHEDEEDVYAGWDGGRQFNLAVGEDTEVSEEKAAQLAEDFPGCFEIDGKIAGERRTPAPEPSGDLRDELLKHRREELNAAAKELGIDAPEAMQNKAAVVDAIIAAREENA